MFETQDLYDWLSTTQTENVRLDFLEAGQIIPATLADVHDQDQLNMCSEVYPNRHFVLNIPGGSLMGQQGFILTPEHTLLRNPQTKNDRSFIDKKIAQAIHEFDPNHFTLECLDGNVASISSIWTFLYYHWMVEILPRLFLLKQANLKIDRLVTSPLHSPFHQETLERMGFPPSKCVEMKTGCIYRTRNLYIPSIARYAVDREVFSWVRDLFPHPKAHRRHLYISRAGAGYRRILNEEELYPILESYDFEIVRLEKMTVDDQAKLFSQAAIVMGAHGGGFTNALFMKPGGRIVELYAQHNRRLFFYRHLAEYIGFEYHVFWGVAPPKDENPTMDFTLPPEQLKGILENELKLVNAPR